MRRNQFISDIERRKLKRDTAVTLFLFILLILCAYSMSYVEEVKPVEPVVVKPLTEMESKIATHLQKENSPVSVEAARAISKHKRPRLLTAVASVESNGTPSAKGKLGEQGMYQVRADIWGTVPNASDIQGQTDQAAEILEALIAEHDGNLRKALSAYNGDRTGKYANKVLAKVERIK